MTRLSDAQARILSAAAQREDRNVLPLPGSLRGGAADKVIGALIARGLIAETTTGSRTKADAALNRFWRNDEDGRAILLHITDAGLAAIGVEPEDAPESADTAPEGGTEAPDADTTPEGAEDATPEAGAPAGDTVVDATEPKERRVRTGTKQAQLIQMLRAPEGATLDEIAAATGWQKHTIRGAFAGALKKKLGLEVTSEKIEGRGRVYRIDQGS